VLFYWVSFIFLLSAMCRSALCRGTVRARLEGATTLEDNTQSNDTRCIIVELLLMFSYHLPSAVLLSVILLNVVAPLLSASSFSNLRVYLNGHTKFNNLVACTIKYFMVVTAAIS
jgi:hypothetical protein